MPAALRQVIFSKLDCAIPAMGWHQLRTDGLSQDAITVVFMQPGCGLSKDEWYTLQLRLLSRRIALLQEHNDMVC